VSQAVDPGLLQVLECDIVPRLENDVPNQPSTDQLDPTLTPSKIKPFDIR
jgi:hypothetical protein